MIDCFEFATLSYQIYKRRVGEGKVSIRTIRTQRRDDQLYWHTITDDVLDLVVDLQLERVHWRIEVDLIVFQ